MVRYRDRMLLFLNSVEKSARYFEFTQIRPSHILGKFVNICALFPGAEVSKNGFDGAIAKGIVTPVATGVVGQFFL